MTLVIESTFIKSSKCSIPIWISWIFVVKFQLKNPNFLLVHLLSHTFFFCSRELRIQINPPFSFQKICSDRALWQSLSSKKDHSNNTIRRTNIQDMAPQIWHKHISLLFYLLRMIVTHLVFPNTLFSGCFLLCTRLSCIFFNTFFVLRRHTNSMMNLSHITPLKWNLFWISWNHDLN